MGTASRGRSREGGKVRVLAGTVLGQNAGQWPRVSNGLRRGGIYLELLGEL